MYRRIGMSIVSSCLMAGISRTSYAAWIKKGARDWRKGRDTLEAKFYIEIKKAVAQFEARNLSIISKAAEKQWQASAWLLERRLPKKWGKKNEEIQETGQQFKVVSFTESIRPPLAKNSEENP
jgi:hypothetical protein